MLWSLVVESVDTGAQEGKVVGREGGKRDDKDKGSSHRWCGCGCRGGMWLVEQLASEISLWQEVEEWVGGGKWAFGGKIG